MDTLNAQCTFHSQYLGISIYMEIIYPGWSLLVLVGVSFGVMERSMSMIHTDIYQPMITSTVGYLYGRTTTLIVVPLWSKFASFGSQFHVPFHQTKSWQIDLLQQFNTWYQFVRMIWYDVGILFEAVFIISLTPSTTGWYDGIMTATWKLGKQSNHCFHWKHGTDTQLCLR